MEARADGTSSAYFCGWKSAREKFTTKDAEHSLSLTAAGRGAGLEGAGEGGKSRKKSSEGVRVALGDSNRTPKVVGLEELPAARDGVVGKQARRTARYAKGNFSRFIPGSMLFIAQARGSLNMISRLHRTPIRTRSGRPLGIHGLALDDRGNLSLRADEHSIRQRTPTVYQVIEGMRREIASGYVLLAKMKLALNSGPITRSIR